MSHFATCLARSRSPSGSSAPWAAGGRQERSDLRCADLARVASPSATRSPSLPKFGRAWSPSGSRSRFAVHCQALRGRLRRCRLWPGRSSRVYGDQLPVLMEFWRARVLASKGKKRHAVVDRSVRVCKSTYDVNDIVPLVSCSGEWEGMLLALMYPAERQGSRARGSLALPRSDLLAAAAK